MNIPDDFDIAAAKVAGQTANADPIDQAAARVVQGQRTALRSSLYGALLENPDVAARAQKLGRKTGLPADVVGRNLPEVERNAKLNEFDQLLQNSPVVAQWLADQNNAKVAHDDVDNMSEHERLFREALAAGRVAQGRIGETYVRPTDNMRELDRSIVQAFTEPVRRGFAQGRRGLTLLLNDLGVFDGLQRQRDAARTAAGLAPEGNMGLAVQLVDQQRQVERFPTPAKIAQGMQDISQSATFSDALAAVVRNPAAVLETTLQSVGASAPALVGAMAGSAAGPVGTATGAGLGSFAVEYGNTLQDVMGERGVDARDALAISKALADPELMAEAREKAVKRGLPIAAFDALTAGLAGRLLAGAKPTVTSVVTRSAGELGLQAGGGAAGEAVAQAATGEYKPGDILMEALAELPSAIVEVPGNYRDSMIRAKSAEQRAQVIEQLNKLAAASKVRERDVDTFEQFIAQAAENGPVQHVYIDANTLMQSGMAEQLAQVSPSVAAQLQTAVATGAEIQIPVAEYTARIAGSEFAQSLVDDIRVEGEPFTRREAREYMQNHAGELQAEFERVLTEKQNDEVFKASAERVKAEIKSQLDTVARFTPQVNEANASMVGNFYAVMAAKLGTTPEEVFAKYPLRVQAEAVQSGPVLSQGGQVSDWADREIAQVGSWVKADYKLADSQPVYQVRDLNPSDLYLPELDEKGRLQPEKRKYLDSYTERAKAGEVPPSITVIEMEDGRLRVVDGHRRALAAMAAGKNIRALVSPLVDTPDGRKEATVENIKQLNQSAQPQPLPATIEIDGKQRPTTNSNGQPIAATEEGVRNFWKWFGDSKVVDAGGRPLVVYHGTASTDITEFRPRGGRNGEWQDALSRFKAARVSNARVGYMAFRDGSFFSPKADYAGNYTREGKGVMYPVYVKAENPVFFNQVKRGDVTGVDAKKTPDALIMHTDGDVNEVAVIDPTQIKSAIGNSGEFDPANPNILMQSENQGRLMAVHNLSADNLIFADKMGGLAVPSIGVVTQDAGGVDGFGEITLIGRKDLVDPARERVFSSDAYTARFPKPEWPKAKTKDAQTLADFVRAAAKEFGDRSLTDETFDGMVNNPDAGRVVEKWLSSSAVKALFLREQGVDAQPVTSVRRFQTYLTEQDLTELRPLYDVALEQQNQSQYDTPEQQQLKDEIVQRLRAQMERRGASDRTKKVAEENAQRVAQQAVNLLYRDYRTLAEPIPVDTWETGKKLDELIGPKAVEFKQWVEAKIIPKFGDPFIKVGGKKAPYTLDNIVKTMTDTKVKGKEKTMTYGAGQVRAAASVEFSDLEQMRAAASESVVDPAQYAAAKAETEKLIEVYRNDVVGYTKLTNWKGEPDTWEAMDASMRALAKWATGKKRDASSMKAALRAEDFDTAKIPDSLIAQAMGAADALLRAPVPYFEAKPQRAVGLDEFAGAVIPADASQAVRDILTKHNIAITEYTPDADRTNTAREFAAHLAGQGQRTLFQTRGANRGSFNPSTNTITLLKNADLSTFLHEAGHFFLEVQFDIASRLAGMRTDGASLSEGEQQIVDDADALLKWFGVESVPEWYSLDFEEKRGYHEKFARGFEAYLFEGKAPSIELNRVFQTFRGWLLQVYRNLVEAAERALKAAKVDSSERAAVGKALDVQLSDEVRAVFDRMLATNEEIRIAEQARSMMPLFENYEDAKGKVAWGIDEFAAYQALGTQATADAIQDVQARTLRDLAWTRNARGREIKRLQKQAAELRREVQIEARREIMSQPIYRAWQFLTGKLDVDRTSPQEDYNLFLKQFGLTERAVQADMLSVGVEPAPAGSPDMVERKASTVAGDGMFAKVAAKPGDVLARASGEGVKYPAGRWTNHSSNPNAKFVSNERGGVDLVATRPIAEGDEVFINYRQAARLQGMRPVGSGRSDTVDPTVDSLFTAIAKLGGLSKDEVVSQWGTDPKDKPASGVFGKPVWRREGGRSIDSMAEALGELGYLPLDENGKADIRDLEERFDSELRGSPVYSNRYDYGAQQEQRAGDGVNVEALGAGRFDLTEIKAMGLPTEVVDRIQSLKMTGKVGLHPDIVADMFGFTSGDELVRTLATTESPKTAIEGLTDARMLEQYGELATPEAIERAADRAIHNEIRARLIAIEANGLAKATGQRKILTSAARDFARAMIARLKVRDIRPSQYASAEVRAAKAAEKASRSGDLAKAAVEKRNQLVNNYATRAAYDAQDEVDSGLRYLRKFDSDSVRKAVDADYVDQIDALLERFDLRKGQSLKAIDKRTALSAWVASQREQGFEPDIPAELENEAFRKSYKDMTVEEFRGLLDTVKQIEHLGRLKNRLLTAADNRAFSAVKAELVASIKDNSQGRKADTRTPTTNLGRALQAVKNFGASHIKAATWARIMDGGKDGGPMWEYLIRSANERGNMETQMRADATVELSRILAPVFKLGRMGGSGQFFPSIGRSLNREARLTIALNTGNQGNLQRLLGGEGWTVQQIQPVLQSLTAAEWQAVQAVWDHFESYRPQIGAKERRVYGRGPEWVDPAPFTIKAADGVDVSLRGGYYPIKYDPAASQRAEEYADAEGAKRQLQGAFTSATTRRSFTKSRAEEVSGRPLLYTLSGLYGGVNDVIHDLAWHEWLIDANRILRAKDVDAAIREAYGPEVKQQFKTWAADIAEGEKGAQNAAEMALGRLRQGVSAAGLGFNVTSAAMQITGFNQSIVRVGAKWIGKGIAKYIASPFKTSRDVMGMSEFMADRSRTQFRELNELRNRVQDESATMRNIKLGTYFLMMRMQRMVDMPTWLGAYEKAIVDGNAEERAVALADQAVIDSQGSGMTKDLSAVERGGPALTLFTVFYSYMNTALNMGVAQTMTTKSKGKLAADYLMLFTVPAVLGSILKDALTPGGDDDEDMEALARKLAAEQLSYLMGLMVVTREFGEVAKIVTGAEGAGRDYGGPAGLRAVGDTFRFAQQASQGEFDSAFRKASINVLGDLTGLPSAQINRTWNGIEALNEGETDNPAAVLFGYQKQ